jgi:prevent-host-death family protein
MRKVRIADLKARLSEHLRYVRRGHQLTVMDRDTPVAMVVPLSALGTLAVRPPRAEAPALKDVKFPRPLEVDVDPVVLLLEERQGDR